MIPNEQWVTEKFRFYNAKYFNGKLPFPTFRVIPLPSRKLGEYFLDGKYNPFNHKIFSIRNKNGVLSISNKYSRSEKDWENTLIHEMIHMYIQRVMLYYPSDAHGKEFQSLANRINQDGWNISEKNDINATMTNYNGENTDSEAPTFDNQSILCLIENPSGTTYKYWACKAENDNMDDFIAKAQSISGVTSVKFYRCGSNILDSLTSDPATLFGFGGMTLHDAITALCNYAGTTERELNFRGLTLIKSA